MQMESVEGSKFGPAISLDLQTRLVDTWAENCIPEFYQILFLEFVKHLPTNEAEITIQEEIRSIQKGNSYIQLFLKAMRDKEKLEQFMAPATPAEPELIKLCECLRKLRELNFKAAHYLYKIRSKYDQSEKNKSEKYFFHRFSIRLDQFRKALLKSKLSRVGTWQGEYDPFFMSLKAHGKGTIEENHALQDLLALPVDDSYRFLKMRKVLVGWIYLDQSSRQIQPTQSPIEEKYLAFPQIKNGLMRERSLELQKLKQLPIQEDSVYKRSRSKVDSDVDVRDKGANRTRYFWPRETLRQSTRNGKEPQLLTKSIQENHLNTIANTPYQLPIRNERKSEDVGKIRRSRVAQLDNNILSRASRPRYFAESTSTDKPSGYRVKLQRLNTLPVSPQKPNRYDGNQMSQSPSRMLTKSLLVNIMISPIRPPASKQPEQREYRQPVEQMSSNITEKPPQPRRMTVQSVDLGNYSPSSNGHSNYSTLGERELQINVNNTLQNRQIQNVGYNQPTKRNISSSLDAQQDNRDNVRQTILITKPQKISNNVNASNNAQGSRPIENSQNAPKTDNRTSTINQSSMLSSNQYSNQISYQNLNQALNPNQETSISNYFPRKQATKSEPIKQQPLPPKQTVSQTKNEPVYSTTMPQNSDQNRSTVPKIEANMKNQTAVNQVEPQFKAPSNVQPSANNTNYNVNPANNNTSVLKPNSTSIPPQNTLNTGTSSDYPNNTKTNPQNSINANSNSTVSLNKPVTNNNPTITSNTNTIPATNFNQNINTSPNFNTSVNSNTNPNLDTSKNTNSSINPPPETKQSGMAASKQQKREIKLKVGKLAYNELVEYLTTYSIHSDYKNDYDIQKILKETELQQSYLIEFLINDQPGALALSSIVPINNYAIRLWLIHSSTDPSLSPILFRKYVQLVEKYITAPTIYFKGEDIPQLAETGFTISKEKLYIRNRASKPRQIQREFEQYFNCECSHVSFPQRQKEDALFSQQIQRFDNRNSLCAESLFSMQGFSGPISNMVKVNRSLSNFAQVNKLLKEDDFDEYEANKSITASPIDLLRFGFGSPIKDPFTASEGVFKFYGVEITTQSQLLCCVNLSKNNGKLYFGKNYQSIEQFSLSMKSNTGKRARFCVPMFTKNLYGRYQKFNKNQSGFYGNWEISLVFEDEMQGRVKHSTSNSASFTCPFFVGLEVEGSLLYCLQVSKDDLVY